MFKIIYAWFIFVLYEVSCNVDEKNELGSPHDPIVITSDTFSNHVRAPEEGLFVMFYAPWCGHCKRMVSTWKDLARKHNSKKKFLIGKVDCTIETEMCSDNDILAYPTYYSKIK